MIVKKLIRKQPVSFTVVPMVKRFSHPLQERASFIKNELERGSNYQTAIRAFDSKGKAK